MKMGNDRRCWGTRVGFTRVAKRDGHWIFLLVWNRHIVCNCFDTAHSLIVVPLLWPRDSNIDIDIYDIIPYLYNVPLCVSCRVSFVILFRILGGDPTIDGLEDFNDDGDYQYAKAIDGPVTVDPNLLYPVVIPSILLRRMAIRLS